ncbi:MerR family transcriptional regulator [Deferribacter autotrophicus]|uniref:MerR family transcriptional regulator n=1 Tax=Deferribacter autotrophicus TaxID=500465 RepID=A0A5A8F7K1_9BACT|nr:MerR family transcriptional regulator [Deferribacter autotrophicus]KAA0259028.1 MerR family transcriptional regulator [Deferribacter autotrophicus]
MKINNEELFQIGEVAEMLGITTRTIRYYEEIGLMDPPQRLEGGIRIYTKDDIKRLKFILKLKELGISLKEMQELAQIYKIHQTPEKIMPKLIEILDSHIAKIDEKIAKLASLRKDIVDYKTRILEILKQNNT